MSKTNYLTEEEFAYLKQARSNYKFDMDLAQLVLNKIKQSRPHFDLLGLKKREIAEIVARARTSKQKVDPSSLSTEQIYTALNEGVKFSTLHIESMGLSLVFQESDFIDQNTVKDLIYHLRAGIPKSLYFWGGLTRSTMVSCPVRAIIGFMTDSGPKDIRIEAARYPDWQTLIKTIKDTISSIKKMPDTTVEHLCLKQIQPYFNTAS